MSHDPVMTQREGAVGVLRFNRTDKLNALDMTMVQAIDTAFGALQADPQVRVIVLTGADDRAFMAGGDINDLATRRPRTWHDEFGPMIHGLFQRIESCDKPTVAAVNGWALGGGTELLLAHAATPEQEAAIGRQGGGRVAWFLYTDDFASDHARMLANGVRFLESPRHEDYGTVAVFEDLYGMKWDLLQMAQA